MLWTFNSYSNEWISEQDCEAVLQPHFTPAAEMSTNFVWDEENKTYWIVWDPDVTLTPADAATANAVSVSPQATEGQETWTIEVVNLLKWENFNEPEFTVETLSDAAIEHCSCETYTLDDTGPVTSGSDCDILWDYDFNEHCNATATRFDFGLFWTWLCLAFFIMV